MTTTDEFRPGQQLGHYTVVAKLGQGGMGAVYEATDPRLSRSVAVKVLPAGVTSDPERRARFHQEARLAASLNHPNIATVHDFGEEDGVTFIVMELVRGKSLRELASGEQLPIDRALDIAIGVAAGLARAHREGVLHRDLKPDNVVLSEEGQPKILDFGLGKLLSAVVEADDAPTSQAETVAHVGLGSSPYVTRDGQLIGTLAYMSPEQVQGRAVSASSDVFSFGVLLYELLTGQHPFAGESNLDTVSSILRDAPAALTTVRPDLPVELHSIAERCLAKEPGARYESGHGLLEALEQAWARLYAPATGLGSILKQPRFIAAAAVVGLVLAAGSIWFGIRTSRVNWARDVALPEAERLADEGDRDAAMRLLLEAGAIIPGDRRLDQQFAHLSAPLSVESEPAGAEVFTKGYLQVERPWIRLGQTPLKDVPVTYPQRFRVEKPGYLPFEAAPFDFYLSFELFREGEAPDSMVRVPAGMAEFGNAGPVEIEAFWIDKYEVTNRQFKEFLDSGGYRNPDYWREPIRQGNRELTMDEAASLWVDSTGRPGPAGWELGSFAAGTAEEPVGGISWYEAAAFASWAGKSLPSVFHWHRAAQQGVFSEILLASNFDGDGPAPVGSYDGLGPVGTYDMAGNVREWCLNLTGGLRYILGGAWSEPSYLYRDYNAADPLDRALKNGVRCIKTDGPLADGTTVAIDQPVYDFRQAEPVGDEAFQIVRGLFAYDSSELDARVESVDDAAEHWREEVVTLRAAYGDERVPVHLFLPKNTSPPYQAVVYFPGAGATFLSDSRNLRFEFAKFLPRSGRALVYPIYKGTYERQVEWNGMHDTRDNILHMSKDLQRTIDYLETRDDFDTGRLAYFGLSLGAAWGPIFTAIEGRFAASILLAGGLGRYPPERPPESIPLNFVPRSTVPVLMINGRNDFDAPLETMIEPMFDLQGAPAEQKRLWLHDGGHVPESANPFISEALDWLDKYLGPVEPGDTK